MNRSPDWDTGYDDAIEWCNKNYKPFQSIQLPEQFNHRGDAWSRGFGEGLITGRNKIIDKEYPGISGFSVNNGKITLYYPNGHPALTEKKE